SYVCSSDLQQYVNSHLSVLDAYNNPYVTTVKRFINRPLSIAIQGFGNVGSVVASEAFKDNDGMHKVVAVSERNVTLYSDHGLPIDKLLSFSRLHHGELPMN